MNELLHVALEGRGAFRRFKDTLHRVGLTNEWYAFKRKAYIEIAREWCVENEIEYTDDEEPRKAKQTSSHEHDDPNDVIVIPLSDKIADDAADILCEAFPWCYGGSDADQEVKRMLSKKRVALAAIVRTEAGLCVAGIVGATPQYGVTGWELHPLAVLKEYRGRGFGRLLVEALESEVASRGGVMIYEFYPPRGFGRLNLREAKKAISDFKKLCPDKMMVIDLLLFYVENCVAFTNDYGDIDERFYNSAESVYEQAVNEVNNAGIRAYEKFAARLEAVVNNTSGIGWGFHDCLREIYNELER